MFTRPSEIVAKAAVPCIFGVVAMALVGQSMRLQRDYKQVAPEDLPGLVVVEVLPDDPASENTRTVVKRLIGEGYPLQLRDVAPADPEVESLPTFITYYRNEELRRRTGDLPESEIRRLWLPAYRRWRKERD